MKLFPIKTKTDYERALSLIEENFDAKISSEEGKMVEIMAILVERYEDEHFPMEKPTPIEAIKFRMEQLGISNAELAKIIGTTSRVSEIFSGKRSLSLKMMRRLHQELDVPAEILLGI